MFAHLSAGMGLWMLEGFGSQLCRLLCDVQHLFAIEQYVARLTEHGEGLQQYTLIHVVTNSANKDRFLGSRPLFHATSYCSPLATWYQVIMIERNSKIFLTLVPTLPLC